MSVTNQKVVFIHKNQYKSNFLQIGINEMRLAQQQMTYCEFVLYLYLAGNADGFKLELSQVAFENATGYKKTAYHNAVNRLLELGYLTHSYKYQYEFHTTPVRSNKLNFEGLSGGKLTPPLGAKNSAILENQVLYTNREIDNTDKINKKDKEFERWNDPIIIKKTKPAKPKNKYYYDFD